MNGDVSIRDVTTQDFVGVTESDTVMGATRLMREDEASCAVVLRGNEPVGIVTERDVVDLVAENGDPETVPVTEIMSEPVVSVHAEDSLDVAADRMGAETIRHLVVQNEDGLFGVLAANDLLNARSAGQPPSESPTAGDLIANGGIEVADDRDAAQAEATFDPQSICEICGKLTDSLAENDGQMVCADCRDR